MKQCLFDDFINITLLHQSLMAVIRCIDERFCFACQELGGEPKWTSFYYSFVFSREGFILSP